MIGAYDANHMYALDCRLCDDPILPGQLYMGGNGNTVHLNCAIHANDKKKGQAA